MRSFFFNLLFFLIFSILLVSGYLYGLLTISSVNRPAWRQWARKIIRLAFRLGGLKITVRGQTNLPLPDQKTNTYPPAIYCANHQSYFDGLIIFAVTEAPLVAVTAPQASFPKLLTVWFPKLGFLEVARDTFEELRYPTALAHATVINRAIEIIKSGDSFLIFPEGRREFTRHLIPFHPGVAKIALQTKVPIIPIVLKHVDELLPPNQLLLKPHPIEIEILPAIKLHQTDTDPITDITYLQNLISSHLPKRYSTHLQPPHNPQGKRAAFFDLDGTITRHDFWQLLGKHYFSTHLDVKRLFKLLHLSANRSHLSHEHFFIKTLNLLSGLAIADLTNGLETIVRERTDQLCYPDILALIDRHRQEDNLIFIISEEPTPFLEPICRALDLPGYGTPVGIHNNCLTGRLAGPICKDEEKRHQILTLAHQNNIDLTKSYAYGNSWHDYPMLRTVAHPFLVNPAKDLKRRGEQIGCKVIHLN